MQLFDHEGDGVGRGRWEGGREKERELLRIQSMRGKVITPLPFPFDIKKINEESNEIKNETKNDNISK